MNQFIFPLKVYVEDTDYAGVVYHSNYLNFFTRARSEWAEQQGYGLTWQAEQGIYFPVRSIKIDFLKPAKLNDHVEVVTKVLNVGRASVVYEQHLRLSAMPHIILCKAEVKIACVDKQLRPCALPFCQLNELITGDKA